MTHVTYTHLILSHNVHPVSMRIQYLDQDRQETQGFIQKQYLLLLFLKVVYFAPNYN